MTSNQKSPLPRIRTVPPLNIQYDREEQITWPHVVKFSGGRSSALMLLGLLYGRQLRRSRGDVVVFNNTSAEHPATYEFTRICKEITEQRFNIPFLWTEFQTFEDARRGQWSRIAGYRLVQSRPFSKNRQDGFRNRGEVFEELISWKQALPNRFTRTCTEYLKLHTTVRFLEEWFGRSEQPKCQASTHRLGHWYGDSRMDFSSYGDRSTIVKYHLNQPVFRAPQVFQDYSEARLSKVRNKNIVGRTFDSRAQLRGDDAVEFVSLVGLRSDEPRRVARLLQRNNALQYLDRLADGEYIYAPLYDHGISKHDVFNFWSSQRWDLELPWNSNLSNCVFCFMKGESALREISRTTRKGERSASGRPHDISWWADIERRYARVVPSTKDPSSFTRFGFFGANRLEYEKIIDDQDSSLPRVLDSVLPCDCTD